MRWDRHDICQAYAVLFFAAAKRGDHVRRCGRETYEQLKRLRFEPSTFSVRALTPNGLAIYAAAHLRERGFPIDCPICEEHTLRYPCPLAAESVSTS
jgi:hypothetical protein